MKKLHLLCNAHLDPIWLWNAEEGAGEALSTFRIAADFCEKYDGFVFNHNEALLYEWVQKLDSVLFSRIQQLVKERKWHIMGGWFLQPDCNMPSGEAIIRQILYGRNYFQKYFGVCPSTAVNLDPFGHSRGLVQILKKAGFDSYLFMRPDANLGMLDELPQKFIWEGYDGSEVTGFRLNSSYNSPHGKAVENVSGYLDICSDEVSLKCWGIGNHGGGPSEIDLQCLNRMIEEKKDEIQIEHSVPERFFQEIQSECLPTVAYSLNPMFVGCYTSMHRVKQLYRQTENRYFRAEKMLCAAELATGRTMDASALQNALYNLLFCQFHDVLPGTCIKAGENTALKMLYAAMDTLDRCTYQAFLTLLAGQPKAAEGTIPIFVYNPHSYEICDVFECGFSLPDQNWEDSFMACDVYDGDTLLPSQLIKEESSLSLDWMKKIAFEAVLKPFSMHRFDIRLKTINEKPNTVFPINGDYTVESDTLKVTFDSKSGLIKSILNNGREFVKNGFGRLLVFRDNPDPWRTDLKAFQDVIGEFMLMTPEEAAAFAGIEAEQMAPIQVIEQGTVKTSIEVLLKYHHSFAKMVYHIPRRGMEIKTELCVFWNERDRLLKYAFDHHLCAPEYKVQSMLGEETVVPAGGEQVMQKWMTACEPNRDMAISIINTGIYGMSATEDTILMNLLRSPAYSALPVADRPLVVQNRYTERMDQGQHEFTFFINVGTVQEITEATDIQAQVKNEEPYLLSIFPSGNGLSPNSPLKLSNARLDAFKKSEDQKGYIVRVFNPKAQAVCCCLECTALQIERKFTLNPFEVKTYYLKNGDCMETDLIENVK